MASSFEIVVDNLPLHKTNKSTLSYHFNQCGGIKKIKIIPPKNNNNHKNRAYIQFYEHNSFINALYLNGTNFHGKSIAVNEVQPKPPPKAQPRKQSQPTTHTQSHPPQYPSFTASNPYQPQYKPHSQTYYKQPLPHQYKTPPKPSQHNIIPQPQQYNIINRTSQPQYNTPQSYHKTPQPPAYLNQRKQPKQIEQTSNIVTGKKIKYEKQYDDEAIEMDKLQKDNNYLYEENKKEETIPHIIVSYIGNITVCNKSISINNTTNANELEKIMASYVNKNIILYLVQIKNEDEITKINELNAKLKQQTELNINRINALNKSIDSYKTLEIPYENMMKMRDKYTNEILLLKQLMQQNSEKKNRFDINNANNKSKQYNNMEYVNDQLYNSNLLIKNILEGEMNILLDKLGTYHCYEKAESYEKEGGYPLENILDDLRHEIIDLKYGIERKINIILKFIGNKFMFQETINKNNTLLNGCGNYYYNIMKNCEDIIKEEDEQMIASYGY